MNILASYLVLLESFPLRDLILPTQYSHHLTLALVSDLMLLMWTQTFDFLNTKPMPVLNLVAIRVRPPRVLPRRKDSTGRG